ncbi:hypothetical protein HK097_004772 [Rhizophlyctis rosea]|uniref:Large ribosomal subunit protein uL6 alpha-beta domain-containing protein n=1 Tax=Rhizophlyctis rosea TaxID=64517 RepID=A0AAD5X3F6_9FUNG|nr:hypothetical protein HK097_004772 [Rhizophlyctis rosea]
MFPQLRRAPTCVLQRCLNPTTPSLQPIRFASSPFSSTPPTQSRVGCQVLKYPQEVKIALEPCEGTPQLPRAKQQVVVTGPKGTLAMPLQPYVSFSFLPPEPNNPKQLLTVAVANPIDDRQRAMWGTTRRLIGNMVEGVLEGYTVPLKFVGVGYRALMEDGKLSLKLGYSHPILMDIPSDVQVQIPVPTRVILTGLDKHRVTLFAAQIRKWRQPEPYNLKGIFVGNERIKKKEGKKR